MLILDLLGMYFDAAVVFVTSHSLLFRLALAILCLRVSFPLSICNISKTMDQISTTMDQISTFQPSVCGCQGTCVGRSCFNAAHQHTPILPRPWWYEFLNLLQGVLN